MGIGSLRTAKLVVLLVVAAALAAANPASSSAATEFEAESYPAAIKGENTTTFAMATTAGTLKCKAASFSGEIAANTTEMTLSPSLSECTLAGVAATVSVGTCKYKLHVIAGPSGPAGTLDITPPGCAGFQISIPAISCTVTIPAQTGLSTITYVTDTGPPATITTTVNVSGISYTTSTMCPGGAGSHTNGTNSFAERFKAFVGGVQRFFRIHP